MTPLELREGNGMVELMRWLLVLPVACGVFIALNFAIAFVGELQSPGDSPYDLWYQLLNSTVSPYLGVLTGALVAPRHRTVVAVALVACVSLYMGVVYTLSFEHGLVRGLHVWRVLIEGLVLLGSCVLACVHVARREHDQGLPVGSPVD